MSFFKYFFIFFCFFCSNINANSSKNLTIFAEKKLAIALTKIARIYSQKSNVVVSINFNSSAELIKEIDSGEPANLFISQEHKLIETLKQKGLVDVYNIGYIAYDQPVIAISIKHNQKEELSNEKGNLDKILQFLNKNKSEIIVDQQFSSNKNLLEKIKKNKNLKISYKDIDKNLLTTKEDEQKYFLTFYSQIVNDENFLLIAKSDEQIFCQALVIAGDNMQNAREFLKFLKSDQAKSVIKASGFFVD